MKVMILAAGRGARMGKLTADCPKPLLSIGGKPIIVRLIEQLCAAGYQQLVINHAWQGHKLISTLGDGSRWGTNIEWSAESTALETAGGIANALPLLGDQDFAVVNGDIFSNFDFSELRSMQTRLRHEGLVGECVLVPNPEHHRDGDFTCDQSGLLGTEERNRLTFSGIGVYSARMFAAIRRGEWSPLGPLLRRFAGQRLLGARVHHGLWSDIGTPERLNTIDQQFDPNGNQT